MLYMKFWNININLDVLVVWFGWFLILMIKLLLYIFWLLWLIFFKGFGFEMWFFETEFGFGFGMWFFEYGFVYVVLYHQVTPRWQIIGSTEQKCLFANNRVILGVLLAKFEFWVMHDYSESIESFNAINPYRIV